MFLQLDLLNAVKGEEQDVLLGAMEEVWLEEGCFIDPMDPDQSSCFLIISGFVEVDDPLFGRSLLPPGTLFGIEEILQKVHTVQRYRAVGRTTLLALTQDALGGLLASEHSVSMSLHSEIARIAGLTVQRRLAALSKHL